MTDLSPDTRPVDTETSKPGVPPVIQTQVEASPSNDAGAVREPNQDRRWWVGMPAAIIGLFMVALDQSLTGIASTAITATLGASTIDAQWVTTINRVGQAIAIPAAAWMCKRFGLRRMFITAMVLYIILSLASLVAPTLNVLAVCRFLLGLPGGIVSIAAIGALITTVPMSKVPVAVPLLQAFVVCAPGFGPVIGGLLVQDSHWRDIFWVTIVLAVFGMFAAAGLKPPPAQAAPPPPFDMAGFSCLAGAVVAFTIGVSKGNDWGWTSYPVVILLVVSVDLAALFVIIERQREHPLLDMAMFKGRTYCVALVLTAIIGVEQSMPISVIPTFLRQVQGLSAADAGAVMVPQAVTFAVAVVCGHALIWKIRIKPTMVIGLILLAGGDLLLVNITVDMPRPLLATLLCLRAIGLGLAFVPILVGATSKLPMNLLIDAIQFRTIIQRVVGAVLVTFLVEIASHRQRQILNDQSGLLSPDQRPDLYAQNQTNPDSLLSLWNQLKSYGTAQSYNEVFVIAAVLSAVAFVLVFIPRWGAPPGSSEVVVRDGG